MAVITISRQVGSLGTEVAQTLAERLHYEYADKEKIGKVLATYGFPELELERFDEKKPPFWDTWQIERKRFLHFLEAVIYDFARKENAVIVGRGGQVLLKDLPGVLHVRVTAPLDLRVKRVREDTGDDEKQAARLVRRNDRDSEGFIRSFFDVEWEDSRLYDLVISTEKISVETAVEIISTALQSRAIQQGVKKVSEKLSDLALTQKAEAIVLGLLGVDARHVVVQVLGGTAILRGSVPSSEDIEKCQKAVEAIEGVRQVDNQLLTSEFYRYGA